MSTTSTTSTTTAPNGNGNGSQAASTTSTVQPAGDRIGGGESTVSDPVIEPDVSKPIGPTSVPTTTTTTQAGVTLARPQSDGDAAVPIETVTAPNPDTTPRELSFLSGDSVRDDVAVVAIGTPRAEPEVASIVLSWLMDREAHGAPMTVLSPLLFLVTIWDAASSAGSGMAAPASGLGTFVLLLLIDRTRLAKEHALRSGDAEG